MSRVARENTHQPINDDPRLWWLPSCHQEEQECIYSAVKNPCEILHTASCNPWPQALPSPVHQRFPACAYRVQQPSSPPAFIFLSSAVHSVSVGKQGS